MHSPKTKTLFVGLILLLALVACGPMPAALLTPTASLPSQPTATIHPTTVPATPPQAAAVAPAQPASPQLALVTNPSIQFLQMIDSNNGWAYGDIDIIRTTDGAATWLKAGPVGFSGTPASSFFLNNLTAWVIPNSSDAGQAGTLFHTTDGGATWTSAAIPFSGGSLEFTDQNTGWVLVGLGAGMSHEAVAVYRTSDAGATWSQVFIDDPTAAGTSDTLPFAGDKTGLTALDAGHAWVAGAEPVSDFIYLYTTADGGKAWNEQNPPLPSAFAGSMTNAFPPRFFSASDGAFAVSAYANTTSGVIIYTTHDAGQTWTAAQPVNGNGRGFLLSPQDFFVWDGGASLFASHDGGTTWSTVSTNVDISSDLVSYQFVDAQTGWAVTSDANSHYKLYKTIDGGATWNVLVQ